MGRFRATKDCTAIVSRQLGKYERIPVVEGMGLDYEIIAFETDKLIGVHTESGKLFIFPLDSVYDEDPNINRREMVVGPRE